MRARVERIGHVLAAYSSVRLQVDRMAASSLPRWSMRSNQVRAAITAWPSCSGANASCSRSETVRWCD
jgi:hypothetical protein